jgi:hypothetical protein
LPGYRDKPAILAEPGFFPGNVIERARKRVTGLGLPLVMLSRPMLMNVGELERSQITTILALGGNLFESKA